MLLEGMSIRACERITGVHRDTLVNLVVQVGERCKSFMERELQGIPVDDVQADEIWGFVGMKEKTRKKKQRCEEYGDVYTYTAIERNTKMLVAFHVGRRSDYDTLQFARKLDDATGGYFQLSTDGYTPYRVAIPLTFGMRVKFGVLVKVYGNTDDKHRYSPGNVVDAKKVIGWGNPDPDLICTSHAERHNLSIRMHVRRMTRLTNAFSKKRENHEAALALFFAFYNYCRRHMTIETTPAVAAGLTDHVWSLRELLENTATHC
jgi:IS1 family transposase